MDAVLQAIHEDMNRRDQYDPEMIAYDNAAYLLEQAIALNQAAMDAVAEEIDMPGPMTVNLVEAVLTALHLAAPCAANTAEERLDALMHRLRKALEPAAMTAVRNIAS